MHTVGRLRDFENPKSKVELKSKAQILFFSMVAERDARRRNALCTRDSFLVMLGEQLSSKLFSIFFCAKKCVTELPINAFVGNFYVLSEVLSFSFESRISYRYNYQTRQKSVHRHWYSFLMVQNTSEYFHVFVSSADENCEVLRE